MVIDDISYEKTGSRSATSEGAPDALTNEKSSPGFASPVDRLAAVVADTILLSPILAVVIAPFRRQILEAELVGSDEGFSSALLSAVIVGVLVFLIYQITFLALWNATPGKRIMGLRVQNMWNPEARLAPLTLLVRSIAWLVELALLALPFAAVFGNERRRPFHDRLADTVVIALRRTRRTGAPTLQEMAMASGITAASLTAFAVVTLMGLMHSRHGGAAAIADLEESGALCSDAGDGYREWVSGVSESKPTRLSVAIAMFGAGSIDEECLQKEARYELWNESKAPQGDLPRRAEAYLAQALVDSEDRETTDEYLEKVCNTDHDGDACHMVSLLDSERSDLDEDEDRDTVARDVERVIDTLQPTSQPYLKVWIVKHLAQTHRYDRLLETLSMIAPQKGMGSFLAAERAKALWLLGRDGESKVAMESALDTADEPERVELSQWFCAQELNDKSCVSARTSACQVLNSAVAHSGHWLGDGLVATTYLRSASCTGSLSDSHLSEIEENVNESGHDFVEALALVLKKDLSGARDLLKRVSHGDDEVYADQARLVLIDLAQNESELRELSNAWLKSSTDESTQMRVGRRIFARLSENGLWTEAFKVGAKLAQSEPLDTRLARKMIVAAYRTGQIAIARNLLSHNMPKSLPLAEEPSSSRRPASESVDSFENVARDLLRRRQ